MRIRAAVLRRSGVERPYGRTKPLAIEEVELDEPGPGEVRLRMAAASLCHSDLSVVDGVRPRPVPMVLGHEAAGVVEALGEGVDHLAVGDHVVTVFVPSCGRCGPCLDGRPALCVPGNAANAKGELIGGGRRLHRKGEPIHHHLGVSGFAERAVVSTYSVVKIDPAIPLELAAIFGCAVLTGAGAVLHTGGLKPGGSLAVVGCGGVGLNAVMAGRLVGARHIVAVDLVPEKLETARQFGATLAVDARGNDAIEQIRSATGGGVDVAVETAGALPALELAYEITARGGTTVTAGLAPPDKAMAVNQVRLVAEERTLKGSYVGSCVPARDLPRFLALQQAGLMPVEKLIDRMIGLDDLNDALEALAAGSALRQVVTFAP
ncbi:MAG: zinc-dependent alcohol dehydrogenase family protein [Pseudomonadota bacterium]